MNVASPVNAPQRICVSCEHEPPADRSVDKCPACGGTLLELRQPVDPLIGQVVDGRFEIRDRVGKGGMGTVYRAWQRSIGREVAVKLIDGHQAGDPMAVRRFMREARLASQLSQPNTVSVLDFGQASDGRLFIAMELVRGRTLAAVLEGDGVFSTARVARVGIQICDALDAAHRLEILHRDLKPPNIIVLDDPPGRDLVKVLDFGLAKSLRDEESHSTETGFVVGTPHYMAPEVIAGLKPSRASDLYSVGVILAELATCQDVWKAESTGQLVAQKERGCPPDLPVSGPLRPLLDELLSPDPEQRPESAAHVRERLLALADVVDSITATVTPLAPNRPSPRPQKVGPEANLAPTTPVRMQPRPPSAPGRVARRRVRLLATGAAVLITIGGGALALRWHSRPAPSTAAPVTPSGNGVAPRVVAPVDPPAASTAGSAPVGEVRGASGPQRLGGSAVAAGASAPIAKPGSPSSAAPARVLVHLRSQPSGASVRLDGVDRGITPLDLPVTRGARTRFTLTLGATTVRRTLRPEHDQDVLIVLPTRSSAAPSGPSHDALPF